MKAPLVLSEVAQAEFDRLVELLGDRLQPVDAYPLAMLATSWATWVQATMDIEEQGRVVSSGGCAIPNPNLSVAAQAHAQIVGLCKELGITPASRKKVSSSGRGGNEKAAAGDGKGKPKLRAFS